MSFLQLGNPPLLDSPYSVMAKAVLGIEAAPSPSTAVRPPLQLAVKMHQNASCDKGLRYMSMSNLSLATGHWWPYLEHFVTTHEHC
jgi:hypothetical protein